jgi:hypothetical protein
VISNSFNFDKGYHTLYHKLLTRDRNRGRGNSNIELSMNSHIMTLKKKQISNMAISKIYSTLNDLF